MPRGETQGLIEELMACLPGQVTQEESEISRHAGGEGHSVYVPPAAVVMARSTQDVQTVMRLCSQANVPVVPFGVGTSLEGHVTPVEGGISLDLSEMDRILEISPDDLTVVVQPGLRRVALNETLAEQGLFFSVDPGSNATLGGMASTGASGTSTVRYGSMRENVMALEVVLADGTVVRTGTRARKDSAGYDLTRLLVGSEGTLGVITELTLRIFGIPKAMSGASGTFERLSDGVAAATELVKRGLPVARCEFLDAYSVKAVNAYLGTSLKEAPTLFLELHGSESSIDLLADEVGEILQSFGASDLTWTSDETERLQLWKSRYSAYPAVIASQVGAAVITTDSAVPLSKLPGAVEYAQEVFDNQPFTWSVLGHVADGNFHALLQFDPLDDNALAAAKAATTKLTARVIELGGTCSGEHGIGLGKRESLQSQVGSERIELMRSVKHAFDPGNILNPGKVMFPEDAR
jgi:D-lactate dehydrogenase (cytochrome)